MATNQQTKTTGKDAAMRQHQGHDLQNVSEKGPFFSTTFSRPFKDQAGAWHNGTSFGLNDLEALRNITLETKDWMAANNVKR